MGAASDRPTGSDDVAPQPPAVCVIAAVAANGVIGRANRLPWSLPADLAHFRRLTLGHPIVMGRHTWESLPGLLPGRRHLVLTRTPGYAAPGARVLPSLDAAIAAAANEPWLMVIGGARLYAEALPRADRLELTLVHAEVAGDTRFPPWDPDAWVAVEQREQPRDARNAYPLTFLRLERRSARGEGRPVPAVLAACALRSS